ncbi:MAG: family 1 glycosylhydrolase [Anaerolineales bacterium]|nr:family 1 glycosylhydrolase [Anaerolineales bacterium]
MVEAIHYFPEDFLWGTATSSHQVEGDNTNNDWWEWEQQPAKIVHGHSSIKACEWWKGRWEEDFDRAHNDGHNAIRLSIEWSRIEPSMGIWDESAVDQYRQMLHGARDRDLSPMVTLHHFTNPLWFANQGGWLNDEASRHFQRYARKIVSSLDDLVDYWVTINEPNVYIYMAYVEGAFPPGEQDLRKAVKVVQNLAHGHARAYHVIHEVNPNAKVGLAHNYRDMKPASPRNPINKWISKIRSTAFNDTFPRLVQNGETRFLGRKIRVPEATGTQDYFGLNYYTREFVKVDLRRPMELFGRGSYREEAVLSESEFIANEPEGLWEGIKWALEYDLPLIITENGVEDSKDTLRPRYLAEHIRKIWSAVNFNWMVKGYFHWSLVDNFEWERGWTQRFGLWALDVETQKRRKRPSAELFAAICQSNGLSSEMVSKYAPEIFEDMFPGKGPSELVADAS